MWRPRPMNNKGIVAVELALLSPLLVLLLFAGIWAAVNTVGHYNAVHAECLQVAEALAALPTPVPLACDASIEPYMDWPL